jgi:CheY-like chemotaxis protein
MNKYDYSGKHILLVEDNELNREIATAILEETGMRIDCAVDGIEAVNIINEAPEDRYDLILMDIQMPRMDGYTATKEIRTLPNNRKANIPIVAMTANAFEEDKRKAFETGMNGHIVKPVSIEAIAKTLDEIFAVKV